MVQNLQSENNTFPEIGTLEREVLPLLSTRTKDGRLLRATSWSCQMTYFNM